MGTITITKKIAKYIAESATKVVGVKSYEKTYYLPVLYKMTEVMVDCNVVTGKFKGEWIEYDVEFTDEAEDILGIY